MDPIPGIVSDRSGGLAPSFSGALFERGVTNFVSSAGRRRPTYPHALAGVPGERIGTTAIRTSGPSYMNGDA